jgi:UDP-N-acetylmuramate: L-alanyl-gamma-D-glutamyl-meso-diaminopimelate ligase
LHIHILGVCGTFMGGVARLAKQLGHTVSGTDANAYPPMSTQLAALNVQLFEGYSPDNIPDQTDVVVVGNTISRGNPELEAALTRRMRYTSGAQWLSENVLQGRWVLAVAGTHGKTTTASLLAWILHDNQLNPGYLIGGVPENFGESARLGSEPFFVIEADEYDTAFFDKRSKFVHYHPDTLVLNNLEFDHADIFDSLDDIKRQFHHLLRIVPQTGCVLFNHDSPAILETLEMGCWCSTQSFSNTNQDNLPPEQQSDWSLRKLKPDGSSFVIKYKGADIQIDWNLLGNHNIANGLAAIAAAHHAGVPLANACESLNSFKSVKRRLELLGSPSGISVYDDFAHHPTAISETLNALRANVGGAKIIAVLEPRSNTMKQGVHQHTLAESLAIADEVYFFKNPEMNWNADTLKSETIQLMDSTQSIINAIANDAVSGDHVLIMSNGGFENLHQRLLSVL